MRRIAVLIAFMFSLCLAGCGIYSFSGTSIAPDVKSISVYTIENRAMKVNPSLSNTLTNALQDKYRRLTNLEMPTHAVGGAEFFLRYMGLWELIGPLIK